MRQVWTLYFPLAASWFFMSVETPVSNFILSLHRDPTLATAAFLPMMAMCMLVESPVIDLLTTSTTLGALKGAYPVLRRYARLCCMAVTLVHAAVVFTPLYWVLTRGVLKLEADVAETAHVPMMIMTVWAGFVGWRRFLQGLMIRRGETKRIGFGTLLRVVTVVASGTILTFATRLPGLVIVAIGLLASVVAECTYIIWASKPTVAVFEAVQHGGDDEVDIGRVFRFHMPLFGTMLVIMSMSLVVTGALGRSLDSVVSLAAWQLASSTAWVFRTVNFALPEVIIARFEDGLNAKVFFRFATIVGGVCTAVLGVSVLFGWQTLFFDRIYHAERIVNTAASLGFALCILMPLLSAWLSYCRAALTARHDTGSRFWAIIVDLAVLCVMLQVGLLMKWPGVVNTAVAMTTALIAEVGFLSMRWRRSIALKPLDTGLAHVET